eukprot:TRINITY_DN69465_c0_g1_i1.p1 TRINITY_DN69465_c0_g1~~TRINITY_DN69465_c0_g1_i1.p1  ORF type:complete len:332 (-),score=45.22 TRINITY_DN69465_c0_g1_i1:267-1262(-)
MYRLSVLSCVVAVGFSSNTFYNAFRPGALWLDTDGNRIRAHSAGLLTVGDTTYWYGADDYNSGDGANKIINVYSSKDLYNWKNLGAAFVMNCSNVPESKGNCYADRPKVLRDEVNGRYVMWMKSTPWVAVATASSPAGPFRFVARWYPNGDHMGDPTAFKDPISGRSYWIYSVKPDVSPRELRVAEMSLDLLNLTGVNTSLGSNREAPAAFYDPTHVKYFIWSSQCTGWKPNAAEAFAAASITQTHWDSIGNPTGNSTSFSSQSTYIHPYITKSGKQAFIYVADRFEPYITGPESGRYVWLPIDVSVDGLHLTVKWRDSWSLEDLEDEVLV